MSLVPPTAHTPAYGEVDLTTCDREPIHVPGAIQPHGVLLGVEEVDGAYRVSTASANLAGLVGVAPKDALGRELRHVVGDDVAAAVTAPSVLSGYRGTPLTLQLTEAPGAPWVDAAVHASGEVVIVEFEPLVATPDEFSYRSARGPLARLVAADTVSSLADALAREVRDATGFDRVMVYRFDEEWNGEVIAEERRDDLNPFLGLHYPHTDIPAQARRLYTVNWIRLIVDIGYEPVPLVPTLHERTGQPLDLSHSTLRSVSPIHVEYLGHMGVTASMSVSLIVDGQLWGLIACHHYSGPHRPDHEARAAAEFLGQTASHLMAERERSDAREQTLAAQQVLAKVTSALSLAEDDDLLTSLVTEPLVREMVDASGIALCFNGEVVKGGVVPPDDVLWQVAGLLRRADGEAISTSHLGGLDPELEHYADIAAGALIVGTAPDRWLMWFRPELEQVVDWGGDPSNAKLYAYEGPEIRLSPRKSFDKWREVVRGRSRPWETWQEELANSLRTHVSGLLLYRAREQIAVAEALQRSVVTNVDLRVRGLEVATTYLSASEFQLGGDWWDLLELDDGRVVFVVGDVAGHGTDVVAAMTQVRAAMRAYLFTGGQIGDSLDLLDRLMSEHMGEHIASAVVVMVDPRDGGVEIVSAGHPAPVLVGEDRAELLDVPVRPLLGVGLGEAEAWRGTLPESATLLIYTDGLVERRGEDLSACVDLLCDTAAPAPRSGQVAAWCTGLLSAVPGVRDDDTTMLAIRRG